MSHTESTDHRARCAQLLREAEAYEKAEDWDHAVAKYRELNELDHLFQGAESKLLFAVRERECFRNYTEGKEQMAAGRYTEALEAFRKAKARCGVYKDTTALIKACEQKMVSAPAPIAPATTTTKKGCLGGLLFFW